MSVGDARNVAPIPASLKACLEYWLEPEYSYAAAPLAHACIYSGSVRCREQTRVERGPRQTALRGSLIVLLSFFI